MLPIDPDINVRVYNENNIPYTTIEERSLDH